MGLQVDWEQGIDWAALREHRLARIVAELRACGLDAVMYTRLDALRYIASFRGVTSLYFQGTRYVIFVTADGHVKFLIASGDMDRVRATMPWLSDYEAFPFLARAGVPIAEKAIRELGLGSAKIGTDMLPFGLYVPLQQKFPNAAFVDGMHVIEEARRVKHAEEVKLHRQAAEVADIGMMTALDTIAPGVTEQ
jgi:Xaa-Pro dipeptidase